MLSPRQQREIKGPFVPRHPYLQSIAGKYGEYELSVKHRDIMRCSTTKHYSSCFRPDGAHCEQPIRYCYNERMCILFKRDRAGAFEFRCFGRLANISCECEIRRQEIIDRHCNCFMCTESMNNLEESCRRMQKVDTNHLFNADKTLILRRPYGNSGEYHMETLVSKLNQSGIITARLSGDFYLDEHGNQLR